MADRGGKNKLRKIKIKIKRKRKRSLLRRKEANPEGQQNPVKASHNFA